MNTTIEQMVGELERLEEMCDEDSEQIVALYRRHIRAYLTEAYNLGKADRDREVVDTLPAKQDLSIHNFETQEAVLDWDVPRDIFDYAKDYGYNQAIDDILTTLTSEDNQTGV